MSRQTASRPARHERRHSPHPQRSRPWTRGRAPGPAECAPRQGRALVGLLELASALRFVGLERESFANTYYAATVKSLLTGWWAFFFAAFDAAGFVTVDRPPAGLWVQAASAKLFGFSGLSLLLPQAVAGVLAVALLYWLVRRAYGPAAGLLAGLALAVTSITVVTDRNNTMDGR